MPDVSKLPDWAIFYSPDVIQIQSIHILILNEHTDYDM